MVWDVSAVTSPVNTSRAQEVEKPAGIRWGIELVCASAAGLISLVMVLINAHVWNMSLRIPLVLGGDGTYALTGIKSLVNHTWLGVDQSLGAPYGGAFYDQSSAFGDFTELLILKVMGLVMQDPAALLNVFYLLTFPLVAISAYGALRVLGTDRWVAMVCAIVFTFLPLHFMRGLGHVFLSAYYAVPVACVLILGLLGHVELFRRRTSDGPRVLAWASRRTLLVLAACFVVGASGSYYALFAVAIAAPVGLLAGIVYRSGGRLVATTVVCATILATMVAVQAPAILYWQENGKNENVAKRTPWESEFYGLRITAMLLPLPNHRVDRFAAASTKYRTGTQLGDEGPTQPLGIFMTFGLLLAVAVAASGALGRTPRTPRWRTVGGAGVAGLITILIGTVSGISAVLAYFVDPQIRAWNRISVYVAFFALVAFAAVLSALRDRWAGRGWPGWVFGLVLLAIVPFVSLYDQSPDGLPQYDLNRASWQNDARFGAAVEKALPQGTMILQLPHMPFPENGPVNQMTDYDHFKGYVHTDGLRWSYGASKGRLPDDWGAATQGLPPAELIPAAVAAGFRALYIDRFGYEDEGAALEREVQKLTGQGPIVESDDKRLALYDLRPVAEEERRDATPQERRGARDALLRPVRVGWGAGFFPPESDATRSWYWAGPSATLVLDNRGGPAREVDLSFDAMTPGPTSQKVVLTLPDGTTKVIRTEGNDSKPTKVDVRIPIGPGVSQVQVATDAPDEVSDPRDLRLQLFDPAVRDAAYGELAQTVDGRPG